MKQVAAEITANLQLTPTTRLLRVRAPDIARQAAPGQFVHVRCGAGSDPLLRRPISIARLWDAGFAREAAKKNEELALLIEVVGRGTACLAGRDVGEHLDLLGPLGRGFLLHPRARRVLLVGGGVGIAPLLAAAHEALARDVAVTLVLGAKNAAKVFPATFVPPEVEYLVLTEDGSLGNQGLVTAALPDLLPWADQVFACGPYAMLRAVAFEIRQRGWGAGKASPPFAQVSLERHMGCAVGACLGCVIETNSGRKRVCRDGPVFDLFEVEW